jgi:hypothetical protein
MKKMRKTTQKYRKIHKIFFLNKNAHIKTYQQQIPYTNDNTSTKTAQKYIKKRTSKTKQHKKKKRHAKQKKNRRIIKKIKTDEKKTQLLLTSKLINSK